MTEAANDEQSADKRFTNKEANKLARDVIGGIDKPFTAGEVERALRKLMGAARTKEGKHSMRVVDTVLQSERKAGWIAFAKGKWTKVDQMTKNDERGASGAVCRTDLGFHIEPRWMHRRTIETNGGSHACITPTGDFVGRVCSEADAMRWVAEGVLP